MGYSGGGNNNSGYCNSDTGYTSSDSDGGSDPIIVAVGNKNMVDMEQII